MAGEGTTLRKGLAVGLTVACSSHTSIVRIISMLTAYQVCMYVVCMSLLLCSGVCVCVSHVSLRFGSALFVLTCNQV